MKGITKIFILTSFLGFILFCAGNSNCSQFASAINPADYNRSGGNLSRVSWNLLDEDFVKREGDIMEGGVSLNSNQIANVSTSFSADGDVASVGFVDNAVSGAISSGAGVFVNWGQSDCPSDTVRLYYGYGYNTHYQYRSGGSNSICVHGGDAGSVYSGALSDGLYPLITAGGLQIPDLSDDSQSTITQNTSVRCAVCLKRNSVCVENIGSWNCGTGLSSVYTGYVLGMTTSYNQHYTERLCMNRNFQTSTTATVGSILYGTRIQADGSMADYTSSLNRFLKCSLCCN